MVLGSLHAAKRHKKSLKSV